MEVDMLTGNMTFKPAAQDMGYEAAKIVERPMETVKGKESQPAQTAYDEYAGIYDNPSYEMDEKHISEVMDKAIAEANKKLAMVNTELQYRVHSKTKQVMIKVMDLESKEVIREIPPEKALDVIAKMWELAGIIIDQKG